MNSEFTIAVHSLVFLVHHPEHMASSEVLADTVCTHPVRIRKVMSLLRKNGYVKTKEGTGGGYLLNCNPEKVTLGELYRLISFGELAPPWRSGKSTMDCLVGSQIGFVMEQIYKDAELRYEEQLKTYTLSRVLDLMTQRKMLV
ncbi:Rrf2 family transcriptional regulator [Hazenella coriacea]|uniref:Rrf2 family protein n=1 Tax=Hazenella coriacea TaxID=1179467 RepID=A0A4R3L645_9BACL|nr:Rrf2 family transcriptional regulator [Hazenella coriacea]TCS94882.1 Rrf2 family protein [Hazenella coriacea]